MKSKNIRLVVLSILLTSFVVSIGAVALIYLNSVQGGLLTADVEDSATIEPDGTQANSNNSKTNLNSTSASSGAAETKADDVAIASNKTRRPADKNVKEQPAQSDKLDKPAEEKSLEHFPSGTFDDIASKAEPNELNDAPAKTRPWKSKTNSVSKTKASDKTTAKSADEKLASKKESESDAEEDEDDTKLEAVNSILGKEIVKSFRGKCVACLDGDTVTVWDGKDRIRIRLQSIDTPESAQAYGQKAKQALSKLVFGKNVTVHSTGQDDYGRTLAFITYRRSNIAERMVELGMAWHYTQYSDSETLTALEQKARRKKVGLWADKNPTAPWMWRRAEKAKEARKNK